MIVLGIESSCDETGAALISDTKGLLADALHTQIDMHRAYGGVVPELASRDHISPRHSVDRRSALQSESQNVQISPPLP